MRSSERDQIEFGSEYICTKFELGTNGDSTIAGKIFGTN